MIWLIAVFVLALAAMGAWRTQRIAKARDAARKAPTGTLMETAGIGAADHGGFPYRGNPPDDVGGSPPQF